MEGQEHKETKRDRVRRILITPLVQAGMRRQTKMKAADCEAMLVRLADKLAHMSDANLRALVALFTRHARGPERNQWPDEVSMVSWAWAMQPPPPRANPYVVSVLQSAAGRRADAFLHHYMVEGALVPRPVSPVPQGIPDGYRLADCPAGSQIFIHDFESGEVIFQTVIETDGADFDFALPDAGSYVIEVDAPRPFVDTKTIVEVT